MIAVFLLALLAWAPVAQGADSPSSPAQSPVKPWSYGMSGSQVRALQVRLRHAHVLALFDVTNRFGMKTKAAVAQFQRDNDLPATGKVDQKTWDTLVAQTPVPTQAELANRDIGPWFVSPGQTVYMKEVQHRLRQLGLYHGDVDGELDGATKDAIRAYRTKAGLPASDVMDERTWSRLVKVTYNPSYAQLFGAPPKNTLSQKLDPRCLVGKVICISKEQEELSYVVDGKIKLTRKAQFARTGYESPEGDFKVWYKNWNEISKLFGDRIPMPYSIFYHDNVAVHYSDDFFQDGYGVGSHGCTQLRDYQAAKWLYQHAKVGDRVVVY
jgi:peptidoglycan hydrolase-like protein with peptidoglycan-binding domain